MIPALRFPMCVLYLCVALALTGCADLTPLGAVGPGGTLEAVTALDTGTGYRFQGSSGVVVQVRRSLGSLFVSLPGSIPLGNPEDTVTPPGIKLTVTDGGITVALPPAPRGYVGHALYPVSEGVELRYLTPALTGKHIVLDPGHGGTETGAVGAHGTVERDLNLDIALGLAQRLRAAGAEVTLTRTNAGPVAPEQVLATAGDSQARLRADLEARSRVANRIGADLFISVHYNSGSTEHGGTEVWWSRRNLNAERSRHLSRLLQQELLAELGLADRGVQHRDFFVTRWTAAPAALVEIGFLSQPEEEAFLTSIDGREGAVTALFNGIDRYFSGH